MLFYKRGQNDFNLSYFIIFQSLADTCPHTVEAFSYVKCV